MEHLSINAKNIVALLVVLITFSSCEIEVPLACLKPSGDKVTETFSFSGFSKLSVAMDAKVEVFEGEQEVTIRAAQNVLDRIDKDSFTVGSQLNLELDGCVRRLNANDIEITVFMSSIEKLAYLGDGSLVTPDVLETTDDISISNIGDGDVLVKLDDNNSSVEIENIGDGDSTISGESISTVIDNKGDGDVNAENLISTEILIDNLGDGDVAFTSLEQVEIMVAGDGDIRGSGSAIDQDVDVLGDGRVFNFDLDSENTNVSLRGDGKVEVRVANSLSVDIFGDGDVCFKGSPSLSVDIFGDGSLNDCN